MCFPCLLLLQKNQKQKKISETSSTSRAGVWFGNFTRWFNHMIDVWLVRRWTESLTERRSGCLYHSATPAPASAATVTRVWEQCWQPDCIRDRPEPMLWFRFTMTLQYSTTTSMFWDWRIRWWLHLLIVIITNIFSEMMGATWSCPLLVMNHSVTVP